MRDPLLRRRAGSVRVTRRGIHRAASPFPVGCNPPSCRKPVLPAPGSIRADCVNPSRGRRSRETLARPRSARSARRAHCECTRPVHRRSGRSPCGRAPLYCEGRVQARAADSHGLRQLGQGCSFVTSAPKDFKRTVESILDVEFPRASARHVFAFLYQMVHKAP
jgi:hypothetical protein